MNLFFRYLFREYAKAAGACIAGSLFLFLVIDFAERADDFHRYGASAGEIARYYLWSLPGIFVLSSPVGILLAVLITVSLRSRAGEFVAAFSGGVSLRRACVPILSGCVLLAGLSFLASETVVPRGNRVAREIARQRVRPGKVEAQFAQNRYWVRSPGGILSAQVVDAAKGELLGFRFLELGDGFALVRSLEARSATYRGEGRWRLAEGTAWTFGDLPSGERFAEREVAFPEMMDAFLEGGTPTEEMTFAQLWDYVRESAERGFEVNRYRVDLHSRLAYPALGVLLGLVAIPAALRSPRSGGVWRGIGIGLLIGFAGWVALSASLSLGRKGILPPALAAWLPGLLAGAIGGKLLGGAPR